MKSQETLRRSYEKQLEIFASSKEKKLENNVNQMNQVSLKIQKLQHELTKLQQQQKKLLEEEYISFEEFFRTAEQKSKQAREKKLSEAASPSNCESPTAFFS